MEHSFTLTDAWGVPHHYTVNQHRGGEGASLALALLSLVVEPLVAGLGPSVIAAMGEAQGIKDVDLSALAAGLNVDGLSSGLKAAMAGLSVPLMCRLLAYVNRDGKPLVTPDGRPSGAFDSGFSRNYTELGRALWEVASYNGFFPGFDSISGAASRGQITT